MAKKNQASRWSFEIGLNLTEDKFLSTVLKRLEKGYGIKDKCAALNITKFKLQASAKDFTPILPEWPKDRIFCIDSQEQWENSFPKILGHQRELVVKVFEVKSIDVREVLMPSTYATGEACSSNSSTQNAVPTEQVTQVNKKNSTREAWSANDNTQERG